MWAGCLTALVTPFRNGALDLGALEKLVEQQIAGGINGLVPCGSTGESATLTHDEHIQVVQAVIGFARGRTPVIAGTGSNSTAEAIRLTRAAEDAGAAGALLLSPYYNKPTQEGIYEHYAAVAEATISTTCAIEPLASLTPTTFRMRDRRAMVSGRMLDAVRPGML